MLDNETHPPFTNRLIDATSPYLLQHAHNPVNWYPWGQAALDKARNEDKPILLSIGYSACHWCHVMAHESFENDFIAEVMNRLFVNIKVDREERPDLDKLYQLAHQVLTQRGGGWPLTMVLTPDDQMPFFAGTYFPAQSRQEMPAFTQVLERVEGFYRQKGDEVLRQNDSLREVLKQVYEVSAIPGVKLDSIPLDLSRQQLEDHYDGLYGGFGEAPKFPHPTNVERLLRHWRATSDGGNADITALDMATTTLQAMALGGFYDQLGGGFYRYCVDQEWMIPHFEKMLYDNGPLLTLYAQAWQATQQHMFLKVTVETADWVIREMQSMDGGYYSSLDADSEGEEGRFYAWTREEIKAALDPDEHRLISKIFGLDQSANFEGRWHLHHYDTLKNAADKLNIDSAQAKELLGSAKQTLFRIRESRQRPGRDEKILCAWNGLMIKGMAAAGRLVGRDDFVSSAQQAVDFIRDKLWSNRRLRASYKNKKARFSAYLDDYAFLLDGLMELLQAKWRSKDLQFAIELADGLLEYYEDKRNGGFYFTADDHEQLIQRPKTFTDEALPSGNGIAAHSLIRLGYLLGKTTYIEAAERTIRCAWQNIKTTPHAHNALLLALEEYLYPLEVVILRGTESELTQWGAICNRQYKPRRMVLAIPSDAKNLPGSIDSKQAQEQVVAYICRGHSCSAPVMNINELEDSLDG